jgi:hypothetical protein
MEITERINILKHQIAILETGYGGIICGQIVDMRDYSGHISNEISGLIEQEHVDDFLLPLREELKQIINQ